MLARDLFQRGLARAAARRVPLAATLAILAGLSCFDDPAGPRILPSAQFSFAPQFSSSAALVVDFERVRIVFTRAGTNAIAFDTVVSFPSGADSITLSLAVPVLGVGQSENLSFRLAMINAAGDTVFRGGPTAITLTAGTTTAPVVVPIRYTGLGANAAAVRIAAQDTSVFFGDSVVLTAVALDSANQPISGTPIEWTSLDTARALVPLPNSGKVFGRTQRGPARIRARLLTGQADTSVVRVQPVPSALALLAGNGQSGTVGAALAQRLAVRATAADGLPVVGVRVRFTAVSGGGTVDTLVVTDTAGIAAAQLRLGTLAGPDTVRAAVTGLTGSPVTFVATALPGAARTLAIAVQPGATPAGSPIAPAVQVAARDTFGNVATAFTGTVTLAIGTNPASGTLSGTTAVAAVAGVATFSAVSINRPGTGYTLTATATGLAGTASAAFNVTVSAPSRLVFTVQPSGTTAGAAIAPAVAVAAQDSFGNLVPSFTDTVVLALGANPGGATLSGTVRVAAVGGVATFPAVVLDRAGTGYTLTAASGTLTGATSTAFAVTAAAPAGLGLASGNAQSSTVNATLAAPFVARVWDAFGNPVSGVSVTFRVTAGGGNLAGIDSQVVATDALGEVSATLTLGTTAGANTVTAVSTGLTGSPVTFTATANPGAAVALAFTTQPTNVMASHTISMSPPVVVAVSDQYGNTVTSYTDSVFVSVPFGRTPLGATRVLAVNGVATFGNLRLDSAGTGYYLRATTPTIVTPVNSATFDVTPGVPMAIALFSGSGQAGAVGTALALPLVVAVQDSFGNLVPGFTVNWAVTSGGGSVPATSLTNTLGRAQATWTLGAILGTQTAAATVAGLTGSPVAFTASASPVGTTTTWTGSASTTWSDAANWSSGAAPLPTDTVFVPAAAIRQPRITANAMVGGLIVQNGATLTIDTLVSLIVFGSADASYSSVGGPGSVLLGGTGTVRGRFRSLVVQGAFAIRDSLVVTDSLIIVGPAANLAGNGGYARIGGDLFVAGNGTLTMAAGDSIDVLGSATFAGGSTSGRLTGGVLRVAQDFSQIAATSPESFLATANHRLVLNGPDLQRVTMMTSGASRIGGLVVANTGDAGLSLESDVQVNGDLSASTSAPINQAVPYTLTVNGNVTTAGPLSLNALSVAGALNAPLGAYDVQRTIFAGTGQAIPDSLPYRYLGLATGASAAFAAGEVRTVDSLVTLGQLDVNGASITTGHLETAGGTGTLVMDAAGDAVIVTEKALFQGGSTTGLLTDGVLRAGGLYVGPTGAADAFAPSGNHHTEVAPTEPGLGVNFAPGYDSTSHFHILRVVGSRVTVTGTARATGRTVLDAYVWFDGDRFIALDTVEFGNYASRLNPSVLELRRGVASNPGGYDLSPTDTLILRGTDGVPDTVGAGGANWTIPNLVVAGTDSVIDQVGPTINGSLLVQGGTYFADGATTVTDSLVVTGTGVVAMNNGDASLRVTGDARFAGAPTAGHLSSGNLFFSGNFRQEGDPQSFRPTGVGVFTNGTLPQVFSFEDPGATASGFRDFYAGSEVRFASDVYVGGTMVVYAPYTVDDTLGPWTATLAGGINDYNTSVPGWRVANTILTSPMLFMPAVMNTNLFVRNSLLAEYYTVDGNVTVESGGVLDAGYGSVTVTGSLAITGTGLLSQSNSFIQVGQDASFAGASDLTGGYLEIGGNFTQLGTTSFRAAAPHTTAFRNGTVTQTVSFAAPDIAFGGSGSHFGDMEMGVTGGVVRLLTDAAVQGTFQSGEISGATLTGTHTLFARGLNWSYGLTIDSTLLTVLDGQSVNFGNATFRNQPATATRFWIRRSDFYHLFLDFTFEGTPEPGGYYVGVENLSGSGQTVNFWFVNPPDPGSFVQTAGSPAPTVCWTAGSSCGP
jgi:hypothetical protein